MKRLILLAATMALVGVGCARQQPSATTPATSPSSPVQKAPTFSLEDYSGKTVSSADFAGTPLVINSWAAWCPFCREELKDFAAVQEEFRGRVVFIAIDRAEPRTVAKQFTDALGVTGRLIFLLDPDDSFYRSLGGFSMPETIFVDGDGFIRHHQRGPMTAADVRERLQTIL